MSVVGFDIGHQTCYVAVARQGGIETIANEYSDRNTPSYISLGENNRFIGASAKGQMITNFKNTVWGWKSLMAKKFKDEEVQRLRNRFPFELVEEKDGGVGIKVTYLNEKKTFTPEQLTAMLLTKLKETAEVNLKTKVVDCVISVPCYYTEEERIAMLSASRIVGLNVLRLMNETTATTLSYGIYKQDLPGPEEKARNVVFVDIGHSDLQLSACSFHKGKLKLIATVADASLGGIDIDNLLVEHFCHEFAKKYKINVASNPRAKLRLSQECEKLKKLMSANTQQIPLNIECFMEELDVTSHMCRQTMEELCVELFARIEKHFKELLKASNLKTDDIYSVEVVGGTTRIPAIKELIKKIFNKEASTTLNADEAVARGSALQSAILSPTCRVRDFDIVDTQHYPVMLTWKGFQEPGETDSMEVFSRFASVPASKMLTFYRTEPFDLHASYHCPRLPQHKLELGTYKIDKVVASVKGESCKVKVKVRVNIHGLFSVSAASMVEKIEPSSSEEAMDVDKEAAAAEAATAATITPPPTTTPPTNPPTDDTPMDQEALPTPTEPPTEGEGVKKAEVKKQKVKNVDLPVIAPQNKMRSKELNRLIELENEMVMQDKLEKERGESKNAVEEYVYETRNKLCGEYEQFITPEAKDSLLLRLEETENWLYDEGESQKKQVYKEKLESLTKLGEPVRGRYEESVRKPQAYERLSHAIQMVGKSVDSFLNKEEQFNHLDGSEVEKVRKAVLEKQAWFEKHVNLSNQCPPHQDPPVLAAQIIAQIDSLWTTCNPIMSKAKPKVEPPKEDKTSKKETPPPSNNNNNDNNSNNNNKGDEEEDKTTTNEEAKDVSNGDGDAVKKEGVDDGVKAEKKSSKDDASNPGMDLD